MSSSTDPIHRPSDKDAICSAPDGDGGYVLTAANRYPSAAVDADWRGALIEETSAFRADVEAFSDLHVVLWDAERKQTLDVREDAADSDVSWASAEVPETLIENEFVLADGAEATLEQHALVSVERSALLLRNRAEFPDGADRTLYTLLNSAIHEQGTDAGGDEASRTDHAGYDCLVSVDDETDVCFALAQRRAETGTTGFDGARVGQVGVREGPERSAWTDAYEEADGWIDDREAGEGAVDLGVGLHVGDDRAVEWETAIGFGRDPEAALDAATGALDAGYEAERDSFVDAWETWHEGVGDPAVGGREEGANAAGASDASDDAADAADVADAPGAADADTVADLYTRSLTAMKVTQDPRGAVIAGPFEPGADGGYRYVWPRDQVALVQALIAADAAEEATDALDWFVDHQLDEDVVDDRGIDRGGTWWQNYRTNGEPHWEALQLDQVGGPIYAHWLYWQETGDGDPDETYYEMSRRAAEFLLGYDNGDGFPGKHQDPWEEVWGYSTEGVAAAVAGLRCMAELADATGDAAFADDCRDRARTWTDNLGTYCFKEDAMLGDHFVTADSPEGDVEPAPDARPDAAVFMSHWPWNVLAADDERLASTLEATADDGWGASGTPCLGRYPGDTYTPSGEVEDGGWPICEAYADAVRWSRGDADAVDEFLGEDAPSWTTAAGLLPEQVRGDGRVRWNANLSWTQATYVLLATSRARGELFGRAPAE